jgi:hypothetical protein
VAWVPRAPSFVLVRLLENTARPGTRWRSESSGKRPESPPRTAQQQAIFDEVLRRHEAHRLSVADRAVLATKQFANVPPFTVRTRARWPEGVPVLVTVTGQFAGFMPRELRATPDYPGGRAIVAYHGGVHLAPERGSTQSGWKDRLAYEPGKQNIGTPPKGGAEIVFETTVEEAGDTIWHGRVAHAIRVEGAVDDVLRPVDSPEVRALLRKAVDESLRLTEDCSQLLFSPPFDPVLSAVTMGVAVEFLRADNIAAAAVFRWRNPSWAEGQSDPQHRRSTYGRPEYPPELWATIDGDLGALCAADPADPEWRVKVRGDAATALEDYDSTAYWSGTVTVVLASVKGRNLL